MYYQDVTVWTVIKRFLLGWLAAGAVLVLISCVRIVSIATVTINIIVFFIFRNPIIPF